MTRDEFVKKYRNILAGLALHGLYSEVRETVMQRGARALDIVPEVDRILGSMFDDIQGVPTAPSLFKGTDNGKPTVSNQRKQ